MILDISSLFCAHGWRHNKCWAGLNTTEPGCIFSPLFTMCLVTALQLRKALVHYNRCGSDNNNILDAGFSDQLVINLRYY